MFGHFVRALFVAAAYAERTSSNGAEFVYGDKHGHAQMHTHTRTDACTHAQNKDVIP